MGKIDTATFDDMLTTQDLTRINVTQDSDYENFVVGYERKIDSQTNQNFANAGHGGGFKTNGSPKKSVPKAKKGIRGLRPKGKK